MKPIIGIILVVVVCAAFAFVTVSHKTPDEMASQYGFSQDQIDSMHELLDSSNDSLWSALLHGVSSSGDSDIVAVAQSQLGNVGGEPYWSWYYVQRNSSVMGQGYKAYFVISVLKSNKCSDIIQVHLIRT